MINVEPWLQLAVLIFTFFTFFLWSRSEASSDRRKSAADWKEHRRDLLEIDREFREKMADINKKHAVSEAKFQAWLMGEKRNGSEK